ncbi:MAG TPA: SusC/RagA family TonB-linked outer membrane protein, partial [Anaerovoracaceae bacterium]|nr:SusC/RagA family TonB-linked outer membrane protein [Anaerovoracaceae bacterium]
GYITQKVPVAGKTVIDIELVPSLARLDEVVVIGYGTVKRKDLTGSVASIKSAEIARLATNNPLQSMQGKIAGIDMMKSSGATGSDMFINLRGNRSINASNSPLFLVDGIDYGSTLDINASDIASIDVLKDASSTAIYGSRGANGVIIITTKRGLSGAGKSKISITSYVSFNSPANLTKKMNAQQEYLLMAEQKRYGDEALTGAWGTTSLNDYPPEVILSNVVSPPYEKSVYQIYKEGGVNLYDYVIHNSTSNNNEISVTGGDAKTSFNISLGYMNENGLLRNDNLKRYNGRITLDHQITKNLKTGINLLYTVRNWNRRDDGIYYYLASFYSLSQIYLSDGSLLPYPSELGKSYCNPLFNEVPGYYKNNNQNSRVFGNMYLEWNIVKGLSFKSVFGLDTSSDRLGWYEDYMTANHFQNSKGSSFLANNGVSISYNFINTLNYSLSLGEIHELQLLAGQTSDYWVYESHGATGIGPLDHYLKSSFYDLSYIPTGGRTLSNTYIKTTKLSYFGRVNYKLMGKYLLTATVRGDGASVLAKGHQWAYFPSVAAAWIISEEPFLKDVNQISNLKLRLSWGKSGNSAVGAYKTLTVLGMDKVPYTFGSDVIFGQLPANLGNEDLTWETTSTYDAGLDISLMRERISATFDFYYSKTYDLLLYRGLPATSVFPQVLENIGNTQNVGFEAAMNFRIIQKRNFSWNSDITFSTNKDKIVSLASGQIKDVSIPDNALIVGQPVQAYYNFEADGCWKIEEASQAAIYNKIPGDVKIIDVNKDDVINDLDKRLYNRSPKFIMGWSNTLSYKGISLSALAYSRVGQWIRYGFNTLYVPTGPGSGPAVDFWTPENQNAKFPRPGIASWADLPPLAFEKSTFLKIKEVILSYNLQGKVISRLGLTNLKIYGSLQNYFTFSNIDNYDPEQNGSISDPLLKQVVFGLNLEF